MAPPSKSSRDQGQRGLALLEVIIALSLFSLVVVASVKTVTQAFRTAQLNDHLAQAVLGLENQMALTQLTHPNLGSYDLTEPSSPFHFHLRVEKVSPDDLQGRTLTNLVRITITARWNEGSEEYSREIRYLDFASP